MDWLTHLIFPEGKFLGITSSVWEVVGWMGNAAFSLRFLIQWYATEKKKRVVVPTVFWWLSLAGSMFFLIYAIERRVWVFIVAYAFNWIPYIRNLIIHNRHEDAHVACTGCGRPCPPESSFCSSCGTKLPANQSGVS